MFDTLKLVFDTFGKDLMVPVMIFIICMIFKAPAKKAFSSAVLVGVGLKGMTFITTEFGAVLSPLVQQLIATTGLNLKALDIGWQAVASVAYSTDIGMMFIGVGLLFQIILWLVKWTDIFMPCTDAFHQRCYTADCRGYAEEMVYILSLSRLCNDSTSSHG